MTYLLVTKTDDISSNTIDLISKLWEREVGLEEIYKNPDFHIIDPKEENSIGIDEIKNLQEEMKFKPYQERVQIAAILQSKKLTHQAQNAFLKTLEESPDTSVYILICRNEKDLLPTIVSRSKKLYSKEKKDEDISYEKTCFEDKNLIECFNTFEDISKDKFATLMYLDTYLNTLQKELKDGIKDGTDVRVITRKISLVNKTRYQVEANGNRRLLLENLYLQIRYTI